MRFLCIYIFASFFAFGQVNTLIADYTYSIHFKNFSTATIADSKLISNGNVSSFEIDFLDDLRFQEEEPIKEGKGFVLTIKAENNPIIFKEHISKNIYSIEEVGLKPFLVKDTMTIFNWELHVETKEILGYKCQKATTKYRGRSYTAYFTTEIPIKDGPWKFQGLPGLILEVRSDDDVLNINVNKIQISKEALNIVNPYINSKLKPITWQEYKNEYQKKYLEYESYKGPKGGRIALPKRKIETLVED